MTNLSTPTLLQDSLWQIIDRLHDLADSNDDRIIRDIMSSGYNWETATTEQNTIAFRDALLPISRDAGKFLYGIARSIDAKKIVEFGTSYGVSTLYFAAALKDNSGGSFAQQQPRQIIGTELEPSKAAKAMENITEAGLAEFVEIRSGDARETLANMGGKVDLLFLDGWMDLYRDVLDLVGDYLHPGSVIIADNLFLLPAKIAPYLDYIRNIENGFISTTLSLDDGIEYSVKL